MAEARNIQYRFRVRHPVSGQELESDVIEVAPPRPPDKNARPKKTVSDRQIRDAHWSDSSFDSGETGWMEAKAPGLDGRKVRFVVEYQADGGWKKAAEYMTPVQSGLARQEFDMKHPAFLDGGQPTAEEIAAIKSTEIRFYATLED